MSGRPPSLNIPRMVKDEVKSNIPSLAGYFWRYMAHLTLVVGALSIPVILFW